MSRRCALCRVSHKSAVWHRQGRARFQDIIKAPFISTTYGDAVLNIPNLLPNTKIFALLRLANGQTGCLFRCWDSAVIGSWTGRATRDSLQPRYLARPCEDLPRLLCRAVRIRARPSLSKGRLTLSNSTQHAGIGR